MNVREHVRLDVRQRAKGLQVRQGVQVAQAHARVGAAEDVHQLVQVVVGVGALQDAQGLAEAGAPLVVLVHVEAGALMDVLAIARVLAVQAVMVVAQLVEALVTINVSAHVITAVLVDPTHHVIGLAPIVVMGPVTRDAIWTATHQHDTISFDGII